MNCELLFREHSEETNPKIEHYCDDLYTLELINVPQPIHFNVLRQQMYNGSVQSYVKQKEELKALNKQVREYVHYGPKRLCDVLQHFNAVTFNKIPTVFKVNITNARFLKFDGNEREMLAYGDNKYFMFKYGGS